MNDGPAGQQGSGPGSAPPQGIAPPQGTAPPQGGAPVAPTASSSAPRPATPRLVGPWLLLAAGVLAAVVAVLSDHVRLGGYLLAATLGVTGLLRAVLPSWLAGAVAARSRTTDVLLLLGAAAACAVLAYTLNLAGS